MASKLKVGFIGVGMIATQAHFPAWKEQAAEAEIIGVADILEERAKSVAQREGVPHAYGDWRKMLKEIQFDVVLVCTPNSYHAEQSIAALRAGAHVHCEKPAATCHKDAQAMYDAAAKAGKHLFIGQSARFMHRARAAKEIMDSGRLGEVYFAENSSMRRRGVPKWGQFHIKEHSGGGPIYDLGVHAIDMLFWLMGNPKVAAVNGAAYTKIANRDEGIITSDFDSGAFEGVSNRRPYDYRDFDVEDMASGYIRLATGATIAFKTSWAANISKPINNSILLGSEGGLSLEPLTVAANMGSFQANLEPELPTETHGWFTGHRREAAHFVNVIRGREKLLVRREEVLNVIKALDALYKSAQTGREVVVK